MNSHFFYLLNTNTIPAISNMPLHKYDLESTVSTVRYNAAGSIRFIVERKYVT